MLLFRQKDKHFLAIQRRRAADPSLSSRSAENYAGALRLNGAVAPDIDDRTCRNVDSFRTVTLESLGKGSTGMFLVGG